MLKCKYCIKNILNVEKYKYVAEIYISDCLNFFFIKSFCKTKGIVPVEDDLKAFSGV